MPDVLLVVDMLRGFLEPGRALYCGDDARDIIPAVRELVEEQRRSGSRVIFVCDTHRPNDLEFRMFPPHCIGGTEEPEVIPELADLATERLEKTRYSAFFGTDLDGRLAEARPPLVAVCGVCTDICVMHTVADARNRDYEVRVPAWCVASFDANAHAWALDHMEHILGARVERMPVSA